MLRSTKSSLFSTGLVLLLISTSVSGDCFYSQRTCYSGLRTWCCSSDETCGNAFGLCEDSFEMPPAVIAVIIIVSVFCIVSCITCCIQSQQRQRQDRIRAALAASSAGRVHISHYPNNMARGPVRVIHVRPVTQFVGSPAIHAYPSIYEAPPPSYDVAVGSLSAPSPPPTVTIEESGSSDV